MNNNDFYIRSQAAFRSIETTYARCLAPVGVSPVEAAILVRLYESDGQHPSVLARAVGRAASSFTPNLDKLEGLELIERKADCEDRRAVYIYLTQNARDIRADVEAAIREAEAAVAEAMSECGHPSMFLDMCVPVSRMDYIQGSAPPPPAPTSRTAGKITLPLKPGSL